MMFDFSAKYNYITLLLLLLFIIKGNLSLLHLLKINYLNLLNNKWVIFGKYSESLMFHSSTGLTQEEYLVQT